MAVADYIVTDMPYADASRMTAAGGSYGGYMIDWILGHTQRFKALISHAGVYDLASEFGATEELWFPLWEFGGTPWDKPETTPSGRPASTSRISTRPRWWSRASWISACRTPRAWSSSRRCRLQKVPSKLAGFPR